jgi:hypothetical protein
MLRLLQRMVNCRVERGIATGEVIVRRASHEDVPRQRLGIGIPYEALEFRAIPDFQTGVREQHICWGNVSARIVLGIWSWRIAC